MGRNGQPVCDRCPVGYAGDRCERYFTLYAYDVGKGTFNILEILLALGWRLVNHGGVDSIPFRHTKMTATEKQL